LKGSSTPLKLGKAYEKLKVKTRVLAVICHIEDYKTELKQLKEAALMLSARQDLRVAYVTNKELSKLYKDTYGRAWFSEFSSNSILVFRGN
jgi:Tfp pilus assembly major pilin PilA